MQVIDSLPYARSLRKFDNPKTLFYYLKERTTYKNDPAGVEYLQTLPTLLKDAAGQGDCDCFVIALLALCWVQGADWHTLQVTLAGRNKKNPVHICCSIKWFGEWYEMDLTQRDFNSIRKYPFTQKLNFKI